MNFSEINESIKSMLDSDKIILIDNPLYQHTNSESKKTELLYLDNGIIERFFPDDNYEVIIGHLPLTGRFNPSRPPYESWTHEVEMIVIGKHKSLSPILKAVGCVGNLQSYDLRGTNIWRQYFGIEEHPENQAFSVRYQIIGNVLEAADDYCREC